MNVSPRRVAIRAALSLLVASVLVMWSVSGTDWAAVWESLARANVAALVAAILVYSTSFALCDIIAFRAVWRRHLDPHMRLRDVSALVLGKQVLFATVPILTKTIPPAYFWRRRGLPLGRVVGASEIVSAADLVAVSAILATVGVFGAADIDTRSLVAVAGIAAVLIASLWAVRARRPRGEGASWLAALRAATPRELAAQLGLRVAHYSVTAFVVTLLLTTWGAELTWAQAVTFGPLFAMSATLPISFGGFGGPQGVAVGLLAGTWGALSTADALAFSLTWSAGVLVAQLATGALFLPRLIRMLRGPSHERADAARVN